MMTTSTSLRLRISPRSVVISQRRPSSSRILVALPALRPTSAVTRVPGTSARARAWNRAIMPQPTIAKPSMRPSLVDVAVLEQRERPPQVLQAAQGGGGEHGVDQDVASPGEEVVVLPL